MIRPTPCRGRSRTATLLVPAGLLLTLGACRPAPADVVSEVTPTPTVTPARFLPTITPIPSPTELPTVIPATATPTPAPTGTPTPDPNVGAIHMEPNLGDLGQEVRITATGFVPGSSVELHWARPGSSPTGKPVTTVKADESGGFSVTLKIPSVWPGGAPEERDLLELSATGEEDRAAWASYTYVVPFREFVAPGSTYTNTTYGYAVDLPPGWTAEDANPANVTFGPEGEAHSSFIRVISGSDVDAAIAGLMGEVAPGLTYDAEAGKLGVKDGKRVVVDDGRVYWFVEHNGRTYALHFVASDETLAEFTYSTLRFSD